jgi:L-fucose isomerase-like protein
MTEKLPGTKFSGNCSLLQFLREQTAIDEVAEPAEEDRKEESGFEERGEGKDIMIVYLCACNRVVFVCDFDFMRRGGTFLATQPKGFET